MFDRLKKLFQKAPPPSPTTADDAAAHVWYEQKQAVMERLMGKQHDSVMHAIIPYPIGGLDLYYYPNGIPGTGVATMEVSEAPDKGSSNAAYSCYELVMFTKHPLDLDQAHQPETAFGKAHSNIKSVLNCVAPFSATAKLNGNDTCEFPAEMEKLAGKCLIFHNYGPHDNPQRGFGVLAVIEIFRSEMDFARQESGEKLIQLLKDAGHFPYSDLDRQPVA
ncbi:MAG TPA: hypothetical protein VK815_09405 [Candidatus Acidoferrales bacterium]|jgi:hypothetical protein|nr:hypothetical protein [Candidatus Acidoferrales bacterium]